MSLQVPDKFFAGMNQTEKVAYLWLKNKEFTDITFDHRGTPDFHTAQGTFEVKRIYGRSTISFTPKQRQKCVDVGAKVLVFGDGDEEPRVILEPQDLSDGIGMRAGTNVLRKGLLIHIIDEAGQDVQIRVRGGPELKQAWRTWLWKYEKELGREPSQEEAFLELLRRSGIDVGQSSFAKVF